MSTRLLSSCWQTGASRGPRTDTAGTVLPSLGSAPGPRGAGGRPGGVLFRLGGGRVGGAEGEGEGEGAWANGSGEGGALRKSLGRVGGGKVGGVFLVGRWGGGRGGGGALEKL